MTDNLPAVPERLVATVADDLGITDDWLLGQLQDIATDALAGIPLYSRAGEHLGDVPQYTAALRALELLMRHKGLLAEKHEHTHDGAIRLEIVGVDPSQLR
jgi:hypothetical protein